VAPIAPSLLASASSHSGASLWARPPPSSSTPTACWVVSDRWAGWLQVLPSFGFLCSTCFLATVDDWAQALLRMHPDCLVSSLSSFSLCSPEVLPVQWCFLQGTSAIFQDLPSECPSGLTVVGAIDMAVSSAAFPRLPPWAQVVTLSYLSFGGVIDGTWSLFSNDPSILPSGVPSTVLPRRLRHVIDKMRRVSKARPAPPLESKAIPGAPGIMRVEGTTDCINWNGVAPQHNLSEVLVWCPLVFPQQGGSFAH
jgi:hypothetical protein